jgi:hypothetical protein
MHQLVTFGELSNDVDTTGTGSMCAVASRVAIAYTHMEKHSVLGQQTEDYR